MTDTTALAFRRAAHAVACFEYGADVQDMNLDPAVPDKVSFGDGKASYLSASVEDPHQRERAHGEKEVRITLAASLSRKRLAGPAPDEADLEDDLDRVREIVWYLAGGWDGGEDEGQSRNLLRDETDAYVQLLTVQTERLLDKRWPQVQTVARALLDTGSLSGRAVRGVIVRSLLANSTPPPGIANASA